MITSSFSVTIFSDMVCDELSDNLEKSYYDKFKGKKLDVLIEEVNEFGSKGHTSNYLMVHTNEKLHKGEIYNLIV